MTTTKRNMAEWCEGAILAQFNWTTPNTGHWQDRHRAAWNNPRPGGESATVRMFQALANYADQYRATFGEGDGIGTDGYMAAAWLDMLKSLRHLLSAGIGRLDGGTLDALLYDMAERAGFKRDEVDL